MNDQGAPREKARRAEAQRRAAILQRYVAIARPKAIDDAAFATELGLSVDSLVRMATAWRRLGETGSIQGGRHRRTAKERETALKALDGEIDLSGVPEGRRDDVRIRLGAIRSILAIERPRAEDWARVADGIGVNSGQLRKMVRAWVTHLSPVAVPGAHAAKRPRRKNLGRSDAIRSAIQKALSEHSPEAPGIAIHKRVEMLCRDNGIEPPAEGTTYRLIRALRSTATDA